MGIIYRHQKQEPLTIEEMDGNFANLEKRVKELETTPPLAEGIATLIQEGDQLTVHGTFGSILGRVTLPKAFPTFCGKWQPETTYRILDWVQEKGGVYSCISPHMSREFEEDQENWALVFEVG